MELLREAYPEYNWLPWRFEICPRHYWDDIGNVRKYMDWAGKELNIREMSDWQRVSYLVLFIEMTVTNFSRNSLELEGVPY